MSSQGWIKIHRAIQDWEYYLSEPFTHTSAWIDLILIANHKTGTIVKRGNSVEIKRGQIGWSEESLAKRWKWSRGKVRRYLTMLKTVQQIEQQKSSILSVITILNYDEYQGNDTTDSTTDGQQTVQQTDTNKNNNNEKNEKNTQVNKLTTTQYGELKAKIENYRMVCGNEPTDELKSQWKMKLKSGQHLTFGT